MLTLFKKKFRNLYYRFFDGKIVTLKGYHHLRDYRWIADRKYGRAYYRGYYEPKICQYLLSRLHDRAVFADVGAHAGYFSLFAAGIATRGLVISFEPEPENRAFIKKIIALNQVSHWRLVEKAVGNEKGAIRFSKGPTSSMGKVSADGEIEVPITLLDEELATLERLDLLKIDVEGYGGRVLEGGLKVIERCKPFIMMEIHSGSDELAVAIRHLLPWYDLTDLDTGEVVAGVESGAHFIVGVPRGGQG